MVQYAQKQPCNNLVGQTHVRCKRDVGRLPNLQVDSDGSVMCVTLLGTTEFAYKLTLGSLAASLHSTLRLLGWVA